MISERHESDPVRRDGRVLLKGTKVLQEGPAQAVTSADTEMPRLAQGLGKSYRCTQGTPFTWHTAPTPPETCWQRSEQRGAETWERLQLPWALPLSSQPTGENARRKGQATAMTARQSHSVKLALNPSLTQHPHSVPRHREACSQRMGMVTTYHDLFSANFRAERV